MGCIYQYVNNINDHMYIGLSSNLKQRCRDHISASFNPNHKDYNSSFHRAIRKYGPQNFSINILEDNIDDIDKLKQREIYWIKYFNTYEDRQHYNETPGGDLPGKNTVHKGEEHGRALLSEKDVIYCRQKYSEGAHSRDIYESMFKDKITYSGFQRMWHGKSWKHIMPEVFKNNPHKGRYTAQDRDLVLKLFHESGETILNFSKNSNCPVGYGTLWNMVHNPQKYK